MGKKELTKIKARLVSFDYCVDNFYMDYEARYIYLNEDDYETNKRTPVYCVIDMEECGTIVDVTKDSINTYGDFIEETYTLEENPEYFV